MTFLKSDSCLLTFLKNDSCLFTLSNLDMDHVPPLMTDHRPPILGSKNDICGGKVPYNADETKEMLENYYRNITEHLDKKHLNGKKLLKGSWSGYLAVAVFITLILTILVSLATVKLCCPNPNFITSK